MQVIIFLFLMLYDKPNIFSSGREPVHNGQRALDEGKSLNPNQWGKRYMPTISIHAVGKSKILSFKPSKALQTLHWRLHQTPPTAMTKRQIRIYTHLTTLERVLKKTLNYYTLHTLNLLFSHSYLTLPAEAVWPAPHKCPFVLHSCKALDDLS